MTLLQKARTWTIDYIHMIRGSALMTVHRTPPEHYLGHVIEGKAPVILIPGILGRWGFLKHLGDRISLAGHPVYIVPELNYNVYTIPRSAQKVWGVIVHAVPRLGHILPDMPAGAHAIRSAMERHAIDGAILVAHSKGGLIGKYLLIHHNHDQRIKGLVAIATPFSGSRMAKLIPLDPFKELRTDSDIIHELESHTAVNDRIISIIPEFDNHVWAERGSFLPGALKNIEVPISGHHKVLFSKPVQDQILVSIEILSSLR